MRTEHHMATRTIQQYSGDLGEVNAIKELLQLGAAVNGLTASDYGWDLHVQVPSAILNLENASPSSPKTWALTGRTAHVQVKRSEKGTPPMVGIDTARGWLTGSQTGTPTFILFISGRTDDGDELTLRYATPSDIADWISGLEREHGEEGLSKRHTFGAGNFVEYDRRRFAAELQLWTRYPNVMLHPGRPTVIPFLDEASTPSMESVQELISDFAQGYCAHHHLPFHDDPSHDTRQAFKSLVSAADGLDIDLDQLALDLYGQIQGTTMGPGTRRASHGGLPVGTYSVATDEGRNMDDAIECIRWLLGFHGTPEEELGLHYDEPRV